jgi:alkylation response protein AidB-like acyl-CoA dehydrogenase
LTPASRRRPGSSGKPSGPEHSAEPAHSAVGGCLESSTRPIHSLVVGTNSGVVVGVYDESEQRAPALASEGACVQEHRKEKMLIVDRLPAREEVAEILDLVREFADRELAVRVDTDEGAARYPEGLFTTLGNAGLLGLPVSSGCGGGGFPYVVHLRILEELAVRWGAVAVAASAHHLACLPLAVYGTRAQRERRLPDLLGGRLLGGTGLAASAALTCDVGRIEAGHRLGGTTAWVAHGGRADVYSVFARTGPGANDVSCFLVPGDGACRPVFEVTGGGAIPFATACWDGVVVSAERLVGTAGQAAEIAAVVRDTGRLGIAACATGVAQGALDTALDHVGPNPVLTDMAASVASARTIYLDAAARRDGGRPYSRQADTARSIATDVAVRLTGYAAQLSVDAERRLHEAHVLQLLEAADRAQPATYATHLANRPRRAGRSRQERVQQ